MDLAKWAEAKAETVGETANQLKQQAAVAGLEYLVNTTPVDTSEALSNWEVGLGRPLVAGTRPPHVPGKGGSTAPQSRAQAIATGRAFIAQSKPGQPIYLSNAVAHIGPLNRGHSKQAPAGFIDASLIIMRQFIKNVRFVRTRN
jgi:hypothetical protein